MCLAFVFAPGLSPHLGTNAGHTTTDGDYKMKPTIAVKTKPATGLFVQRTSSTDKHDHKDLLKYAKTVHDKGNGLGKS